MQLMMMSMEQPQRKRDPNLDHPAVKKYREIIRLQANWLQRQLIADDVDDDPRCLRIWEATLVEHMGHGWNPKDVLMMLKNYKNTMDGIRAGYR
jgi:hypothetical protein